MFPLFMRCIYFIFLIRCSLFATVNEPFRMDFSTGYRNDRVHWHLSVPGTSQVTYTEIYRNVQFWQNQVTLQGIHRDIFFLIDGSYGAFGKGDLSQKYANTSFALNEPTFQFDTQGWVGDVCACLGYTVNLTANRTYKVLLIPLLGYSASFSSLKGENGKPDPFNSIEGVESTSYQMSSSFPKYFSIVFYGLTMGFNLRVEPVSPFILDAGYTYHRMRAKVNSYINQTLALDTSVVVNLQTTDLSICMNEGNNLGHTGWAQLQYKMVPFWRIGVGAQVQYFATRMLSVSESIKTQTQIPAKSVSTTLLDRVFKLRWTSVAGWLQITREF